MKTVAELNESNIEQTIAAADVPVVLDFYAPWCGPCKMIAPLLDALAEHFSGRIQFYKVNVDDSPVLADEFQIAGVPTLVLMHRGVVRDVLIGFPSPQELAGKLHKLAAAAAPEVQA